VFQNTFLSHTPKPPNWVRGSTAGGIPV